MNTINNKIRFSVWLTVFLTLLLTVTAFATSPISAEDLTIVSDSYSAPVGEVVEYPMLITNNPGFSYLRLTITFDEGLALEGVRNGDIIQDLDNGVNLLWSADQQTDAKGILVVLLFRVKAEGEFHVYVNIRECYNDAFDDVNAVVDNGTISSACAHTERVKQGDQNATCVSDGWIGAECCKTCGEILVEQIVVPAVGHNSSDWIVDAEPMIGVAGSKHKECEECHTILEIESIEALPEMTDSGSETVSDKETEPVDELGTTTGSVTEGETTTSLPSETGCSGTVQASLFLLLTTLFLMVALFRKKD